MSYWPIVVLAAVVVSNTAQSQQTQSQELKLDLEQFPEQPAQDRPATEGNEQLQLDLKQFEAKDDNGELELNLEKFGQNGGDQTGQENTGVDAANKDPEINLEQFNQEDEPAVASDNGNGGIGKINNTGSAASKVADSDGSLSSDDRYLIKAGLWFLVFAIPVFLLMRARIRKRRRKYPNRRTTTTYDEENHR